MSSTPFPFAVVEVHCHCIPVHAKNMAKEPEVEPLDKMCDIPGLCFFLVELTIQNPGRPPHSEDRSQMSSVSGGQLLQLC